MNKPILWLDGNRGIYIPRDFALTTCLDPDFAKGFDREDINILLGGPEQEDYWDAWDNIVRDIRIKPDARRDVWYELYESDGDLWLVPEDYEWPEE